MSQALKIRGFRGLLVVGVATMAVAAPAGAADEEPPVGNCSTQGGWVHCTITESGSFSASQLAHETRPDPSDPVVISTVGGRGGHYGSETSPGARGTARTSLPGSQFQHDSSGLFHVYVGRDAANHSFAGGSSTVFASTPLRANMPVFEITTIAGGGGAAGEVEMNVCFQRRGGGSGGAGGAADAMSSERLTFGRGGDGGQGRNPSCSPPPRGSVGLGGNAGHGGRNAEDSAFNGTNGVGGHGGTTGWQGNVLPDFQSGAGGTSARAEGGGGYGGGAAGTRHAGAGGGASVAASPYQAFDPGFGYDDRPSVTISWPVTGASD